MVPNKFACLLYRNKYSQIFQQFQRHHISFTLAIMLSKSSRLHRLKVNKYFIISGSLLIIVLSVDQDIMVSTDTNLMVMLLVLLFRYSPSSPIVSELNLSFVNISRQVLSFDFTCYSHFFINIAFLFQQLASHTANSV